MPTQSLYFISDGPVRAEFHVDHEGDGILSLVASYNPRGEDDEGVSAYATGDELADAIEARVVEHFREWRAVLRYVRARHELVQVRIDHLSRYGVPLLQDDTGAAPD